MSASRRLAILAPTLLAVSLLGGIARAEPVSTGQEATDQLFWIVLIPALGIGILVMALIAYAVVKFRVRPGHAIAPVSSKTHDRRLETVWTVIPAIILLIVGVAAFQTLVTTDTVPPDPDVIIEVNAHQWFWNFNVTYVRNGTWLNASGDFTSVNSTGELTVKAGLVVKLVLRSFDVAHAFALPDFQLNVDVIPGHTNVYWFNALQPGDYAIRCREFCGLAHYAMTGVLHVVAA